MRWKHAKIMYNDLVINDLVIHERLEQGKRDIAFLKSIKHKMHSIPDLLPIVMMLDEVEIFILYWIFITGEVPALCSLMRNSNERQRILANIWRQVNMETTLSVLKNAQKRTVLKAKYHKAISDMKKRTSVHLMPPHFSCDMHTAATVQPTVKTESM